MGFGSDILVLQLSSYVEPKGDDRRPRRAGQSVEGLPPEMRQPDAESAGEEWECIHKTWAAPGMVESELILKDSG